MTFQGDYEKPNTTQCYEQIWTQVYFAYSPDFALEISQSLTECQGAKGDFVQCVISHFLADEMK